MKSACKRMFAVGATAMWFGVVGLAGDAAAFVGAEAGGFNARSSASGGGTATSPYTFYDDGGENDPFASINANDGRGDVQAEADIAGNGIIPTVKILTAAQHNGSHNGVAAADAGAIQTYLYTGPSGTLQFNYSITGTITEPTNTEAQFFASGALVTNLTQFTTHPDNVEGEDIIGFVEDRFDEGFFETTTVNMTGTLMMPISNGDIFSLILRASAYTGNQGAVVDAFSTVGGDFVTPTGGSIQVTVIPEPASLALLGCGGLLLARRR